MKKAFLVSLAAIIGALLGWMIFFTFQTLYISDYTFSKEVKEYIHENSIFLPVKEDFEKQVNTSLREIISNFSSMDAETQNNTKNWLEEVLGKMPSEKMSEVGIDIHIIQISLEKINQIQEKPIGVEKIDFMGKSKVICKISENNTTEETEKNLTTRVYYDRESGRILLTFLPEQSD